MQVDEIVKHEPSQETWQVVIPLDAVLESQASFEQWQNSSAVGAVNTSTLVDLIDNLFSSMRPQMSPKQVDACHHDVDAR